MSENEIGIRKSAILLLTLGEDIAAKIMKELPTREVQSIARAMSSLKNARHGEIKDTLREFHDKLEHQSAMAPNHQRFLHNALRKALGERKAEIIFSEITTGADTSGIDALRGLDPSSIVNVLRDEHPQVIAAALAHLDPEQASAVVIMFNDRLRDDVMLRLATIVSIQPAALDDLNAALGSMLNGKRQGCKQGMGGVKAAAEILNFMDSTVEDQVMHSIRDADDELAQRIIDEMFTFEDLAQLDDRSIQTMMRELQTDNLVAALRGSTNEVKERIFKNMSQRGAENLMDEIENRGPIKISEVELEQKEILRVVRRLIEEGQITMPGKGTEEMV